MSNFWTRHLPPGMNTDREKLTFAAGLLLLAIGYGLCLADLYADASKLFFRQVNGTAELIPCPPLLYFGDYLGWLPWAVLLVIFVLLSGVLGNRRYFRTPSRSVYLMRRLPQRWEYARRVWTVPVLSALTVLALSALGLALLWSAYIHNTPVECLPDQLWRENGRFFVWL